MKTVKMGVSDELKAKLQADDFALGEEAMIAAGEYCGVCGKVPKTLKEYKEAEERMWLCSDECDEVSKEMEGATN